MITKEILRENIKSYFEEEYGQFIDINDFDKPYNQMEIDSLDIMESIMLLEDNYSITVSPSEEKEIKTLNNLVDLVKIKIDGK